MRCHVCGEIIVKTSKSGTCSRKCNAIFQNKKRAVSFKPNRCRQCGKTVTRRQSRAVFCNRTCHNLWWSGKNHYKWNGGRKLHSDGYFCVMQKGHPYSDRFGYVLEHRLVLERKLLKETPDSHLLERVNGHLVLKRGAVVHHKNGIKSDNRISNLLVLESQSEHMKIDNPKCN